MNTTKKLTVFAALLAAATPCFAELPGVPISDVRGTEQHKTAVVIQSAPARGSLFKQGAQAATPVGNDGQPLLGAASSPISFIAVQPPAPKKYKKNDIVTIVVRQDSQSTTNGSGNSKKDQQFDFGLEQFLQLALSASGVPTLPTTVGDTSTLPAVKFKYSNDSKSDASAARKDSLAWRISGTVVDVKPNGTMVIQATAHLTVDREEQFYILSGTCRVEDIGIDNTVLSTQLADLNLSKQTKGDVQAGTKRGWLNKFLDKVSPF